MAAKKKAAQKRWSVAIPITGVIYDEVTAESEEQAIKVAMEKDYKVSDIFEWETHRKIVQGNCFNGYANSASAEEI